MSKPASVIRSKLAVCAAAATIVAVSLTAPAAAENDRKRWAPDGAAALRYGNVEQGGLQVNHRYDGGRRHGSPLWLHRHGKHGHSKGPRARHYSQHPSGHGAWNRHREGPHHPHHKGRQHKHKGDRHYHYYYFEDGRRHRRRGGSDRHHYHSQSTTSVIFYPVPYHTHRHGDVHDHYGRGGRAVCADGYRDGGRYVRGGSHEPGGMILGGIVGAAIGSQVGGGNGRLAAVGVGTLIGALIGRDIGQSMDAADRAYATGSFGHAMEYAPTCSSITWDNPRSGSSGTITPTHTYEPEPGRYCREFQQQVVIGEKLQDAYGTACRQPDGSWEIVAEQP